MIQRALYERGRTRPTVGIGLEAGVSAIAKETGDGDVRDPDLTEQETGFGQLPLKVIQRPRYAFIKRILDPPLIRRLAPDQRANDLLIEETPDEELAQSRVGEFLEPARAAESLMVKSPSTSTGIRRRGLRRSNSSLPKKGVIGSTS